MQLATPSHISSQPRIRGLLILFLALGLLVGAAVVFGLLPRLARQRSLLAASKADRETTLSVVVTRVRRSKARADLELPGTLQALNEAPIYARADGYMKKRYVDIGQKVTDGQLMAELETPELDQQIHQAEASLSQSKAALKQLEAALLQAKANLQLARVTLERWKRLSTAGVFSKQEEDEKQATFDAREADVAAADANLAAGKNAVGVSEANVRRLQELKTFARIVAPFEGIVTGRNVDVGMLISSGSNSNTREMFRVAQIDPLRIFVNVPQSFVAPVQSTAGGKAQLTVQQLPGRVFPAEVRRSNAALDPGSRTMLTILYVKNPRAELLPGMFGEVKFSIPESIRPLVVPGDAVVSRPDGPNVALVENGRVHFRKILPGHDYGSEMEVYEGVSEGDQVIVNPTDEIKEGIEVRTRPEAK